MSTYAISVCDLLELSRPDTILHAILAQHVERDRIVDAEPGKAVGIGDAVVLSCPEEQTLALVKVARKKYRKHRLRFYRSKTGKGGWKRI